MQDTIQGVSLLPYKDKNKQREYMKKYKRQDDYMTRYMREYRKHKAVQHEKLKQIDLAAAILKQKPQIHIFGTTYRDVTKRTANLLGLTDSDRTKRTRKRR